MSLVRDNRGQALQVGAVLLFGILVVLFTVWQAFIIPDQNERIEFTHNEQVQSEMVELRGGIVSTAEATTPTSAAVELGTQFPTRLLFINPSPATGTLEAATLDNSTFGIENANATTADVRQFWDGTERGFETASVEYSADYREFSGEPTTVYDNTVAYNVFEDDEDSVLSRQSLIQGERISVVTIDGALSENGVGSVTTDIQPVTTGTRSVEVEPDDEPLTLTVPTRLDAGEWAELLSAQPRVEDVTDAGEDLVEIELDPDATYQLDVSKVAVGPGATQPALGYIAAADGFDEDVPTDDLTDLTVEVRDRFNTPRGDVRVNASLGDEQQGEFRSETAVTNTDGRATFTFEPDPVELNRSEDIEVVFEADEEAFGPDGSSTFSTNVTTEPAGPGTEFEVRWEEDFNNEWDCEGPEGEDYIERCELDSDSLPETLNVYANITAGDPTDVELQLVNANSTVGEIERPADPTREEFGAIAPDREVDVEFEPADVDGETTTLVAFAGSDSETLELEVELG